MFNRHLLLFTALILLAITRGHAAFESATNLAATIFTETDAENLLPGEVEASPSNKKPDTEGAGTRTSQCGYVAKKNGRRVGHVDLTIRQWKTAEKARAQFESVKQIYRGNDVSGVGEAAFRSVTPPQLHVLKGRHWIQVTAGTFKPDNSIQEQVAAVALRRLND